LELFDVTVMDKYVPNKAEVVQCETDKAWHKNSGQFVSRYPSRNGILVTLSRLGSPTWLPDLAPRLAPTWFFFPKSGRSGIKCPRLSLTTILPRPSSDIATIHPDLAHTTRPDLATTLPDLFRFSYDLPRFIQTYADWAPTGVDLTPT
jgi:hypothetical protein